MSAVLLALSACATQPAATITNVEVPAPTALPAAETKRATAPVQGIENVPANPRADGSAVTGRLAPEHIQKEVRSRFDKLRKCYELALTRDAHATGKTTTRFVIGRDGTVPEARTTLSGSLPADMSACMEAVFRSLTFDPPRGGIVTVTYPIVFSPGD